MPKTGPEDNDINKNAPYRSTRRAATQGRRRRAGSGRRLTVRSEQREVPDVRKIARAIIAIAVAEAEREARVQAQSGREDDAEADGE